MHLHWQVRKATLVVDADDPEPLPPPPPPSAYTMVGTSQCHGMGCAARTGMRCAYVDRRGRPCATAWCPSHRAVFENAVYCPLHCATMGGLHSDYGESPHPDLDNRLPALVGWISATAEDDIVAALQGVCRDRGEVLVSDPVRRVLLGPHRVPTWERAWKACSTVGVSARVAIAIEETCPDDVLAKVNSTVVAHLRAPREHIGEAPSPDMIEQLIRALVMPIALALDCWRQGKPVATEQVDDHLLTGERAPRPLVELA